MAFVEPSPSRKKKSSSGSRTPRSTSVTPSKLPSSEHLQMIDSLTKRIEELEAKDQGSTAEIDRLKAELSRLSAPVTIPVSVQESENEKPKRKSFFGF